MDNAWSTSFLWNRTEKSEDSYYHHEGSDRDPCQSRRHTNHTPDLPDILHTICKIHKPIYLKKKTGLCTPTLTIKQTEKSYKNTPVADKKQHLLLFFVQKYKKLFRRYDDSIRLNELKKLNYNLKRKKSK